MIHLEPFLWVAQLRDGRIVRMGDMDEVSGEEISSSTLHPEDVTAIQLYSLHSPVAPIKVVLNLQKGEQFIRFWRQIVCPERSIRVNVIGIRSGNGIEYRLYVLPSGRVIMSSDDLHETLLQECENE